MLSRVVKIARICLVALITLSAPFGAITSAQAVGTTTISGRAGDGGNGNSGNPVSGVVVTLLDSAGNVLTSNGSAITTTTAADGTYSFTNLAVGSYKVRFTNSSGKSVQSNTTVSGAAGTTAGATTTTESCPAGGTPAAISGSSETLKAVTGASFMDRTSNNLVANGDFTSRPDLAHTYMSDAKTTLATGQTLTSPYMWAPNTVAYQTLGSGPRPWAAVTNWSVGGGGATTYAQWSASTNLASPAVSTTTAWNHTGALLNGASDAALYFGNWSTWSGFSPYANSFDANGMFVNNSITSSTFTNPRNDNLGDGNGVSISQNLTTIAGKKYRLQFWAGREDWGSTNGVFAVNVGNYSRVFLKVPASPVRYTLEFVASSASTALQFTSWGHFTNTYELVLDDVIASPCTTVTNIDSPVAVTADGTNAVINALFIQDAVSATDTSSGAFNTNQTISPLANDIATTGSTFTNSTLKLCDPNTTPAQVWPNCSATSLTTVDGTYTVNSDGTITFDPLPSFTGTSTHPVNYQISDSSGATITSTITPSVTPPAAPSLTADTSSGGMGVAQTKNLLTNDSANGAGNSLTTSSIRLCDPTTTPAQTSPNCTATTFTTSQGTYSLDTTSGVVTFTPATGFVGTADAVSYQVTDATGQKSSNTFTATVIGTNVSGRAGTAGNGASGTAVAGVTVTLLDSTGTPITSGGSPVTATTDASGNYSFTNLPAGSYKVKFSEPVGTILQSGTSISGAAGTTANAQTTVAVSATTVTSPVVVTVVSGGTATNGVVDAQYAKPAAPTAAADSTTAGAGQTQSINVTTNDSVNGSGAGNALDASSVKLCVGTQVAPICDATSFTNADGTYTVNTSGVISFTPASGYSGTPSSPIHYQVSDLSGQVASSTYTPTVIPLPTTVADSTTGLAGATQTINLLTNDSPGTGATLTASSVKLCSAGQVSPNCTATSLTVAGVGLYSLVNGTVTFTPVSGFTGTAPAVGYQVSDSLGQVSFSTYTANVVPPPSASPDTSRSEQGVTQQVSLLGNDRPGNSAADLVPSTVTFTCPVVGASSCSSTSVTVAGQGAYTLSTSGTTAGLVTFVPDANFTGTATPVGYSVADSLGQTATSTVTITVMPKPAPAPVTDTGSAAYNHTVSFAPWLNDGAGTPPAGNVLPLPNLIPSSIRLCDVGQSAPTCSATTVTTDDGTYVVNTSTGEVVFTPVDGFTGTATSPVTYQISNDWTGPAGRQIGTAMLIPTIAEPGSPLATNDTYKTAPMTPITVAPLTNDTAGTGSIVAGSVRLCDALEIAPNCTKTSVTTAVGTFTVASDGKVTFTPNASFDPDHPATINYAFLDSLNKTAHATITITAPPAETVAATPITPIVTPINATTARKKASASLARTGYELGDAFPISIALIGLGTSLVGWNHLTARRDKNKTVA